MSKVSKCRICDNAIYPFMTFGPMPIANGFLTADQFNQEYFFDLAPAVCEHCHLFQLIEQPSPEKMFHENYAFFSQTSKGMSLHFEKFANNLIAKLRDNREAFVVEIGSNDGVMLQHIAKAGIKHLGIEPSGNVAIVARSNGVESLCAFFGEDLAKDIVKKHGQADVIFSANVICHIPNLKSVISGITILLKQKGLFIFEDPYLGDVIEKTSYDQIYDEHVFLFSLSSVSFAMAQYGLEVIDVQHQNVHGGSMRYVIGRKGEHVISPAVSALLQREVEMGLNKPDTYKRFQKNCEKSRDDLIAILNDLLAKNKKVVGYAATSKSTTIINYCGITDQHLECIVDTTPIKQHKYSPGKHIPIKPYETFRSSYPEFSLLFAWNHRNEIFEKERDFIEKGGKWIEYVPGIQVYGG